MTRSAVTLIGLALLVAACGKVGPLELPPEDTPGEPVQLDPVGLEEEPLETDPFEDELEELEQDP